MNKKRIIKFCGTILVILSLYFLTRRALSLRLDFRRLWTPVNVSMLILMPFLSVVARFINSLCWRIYLRFFTNRNIPIGETFAVYAKANVMKYLPGNIGHYAGRQMYGAGLGISQTHLAIASLMEIGGSVVSTIFCASLFSLESVQRAIAERLPPNAPLLIALAALACGVAAYFLIRSQARIPVISELLDLVRSLRFWKTQLLGIGIYTVSSLIFVMTHVILMGQYVALNFHQMFILISALFVSSFVGFITPGAPAGIGVKEAVQLSLLAPYFPEDAILLIAFTSRLIGILGDALAVPASVIFSGGGDTEPERN